MKYENKLLSSAAVMVVTALLLLPGCSTQTVSGKPLAELTFSNVQPLYVSAQDVDVINNYNPSADTLDVSSRLPTPPDIAVRRWAERRLQPHSGTGTLKFVIDSATVHQVDSGAKTTMERWTGQGAHIRYDAAVKISLHKETDARIGRAEHSMTVTRSVTIPAAWSIAKREAELQTFMEMLVADIDKTVTATLQNESLAVGSSAPYDAMAARAPVAPVPVSLPPESGRDQYQHGENIQSSYNH